ncbi:MAG: pentapeptide repeat-containing protein [Chromatiales bacterium]|nr:pentapeptide repeat-containing protein [Chromatiales bacterium]
MANSKQVARLMRSVEEWIQLRRGNREAKLCLSGAALSGAVLGEVNLTGANLQGADYLVW